MEDQCLPGIAMLECNLRLCEMRAGARFYSSARAQRGCAHSAGRAAARVKVLGHAIDNRRISYTFQWQSPVYQAVYDLVCDLGPSRQPLHVSQCFPQQCSFIHTISLMSLCKFSSAWCQLFRSLGSLQIFGVCFR